MARKVTSLPVTELPVANGNWDGSRGKIQSIVIHTIVGSISGANSRFNNSSSRVSAHYGIGLDGNIVHWVDEDFTAYHCGNYFVNQTSIGIEHEDKGDYNGPRTKALYVASAKLVADICSYYGLPIHRNFIIRHDEVPGASTACPDNLDIDRIVTEAQQIQQGTIPPVPEPPQPTPPSEWPKEYSDEYHPYPKDEPSQLPSHPPTNWPTEYSEDYHPYANQPDIEDRRPSNWPTEYSEDYHPYVYYDQPLQGEPNSSDNTISPDSSTSISTSPTEITTSSSEHSESIIIFVLKSLKNVLKKLLFGK
jgi:hypothetical protein